MKKAFTSVFTVIIAVSLLLTSAFYVSAEENDGYAQVFLDKLNSYAEECEKLFGFKPTFNSFIYEEIFRYYSGDEGVTPDFVLVDTTYGSTEDTYSYRYDFGEYTFLSNKWDSKYLIYLPDEDIVYTLEEAYYNHIEGLEESFLRIYGEALGKTGDANGDFSVNIKDATYIQQYTAKIIECGNSSIYVNSPELFKRVSDLNRDHKINIKDATMIQKYVANLLIPTEYDSTPASVDSVEYTEVDLDNNAYFGNSDKLITNISQWNAYPHSSDKKYTEEFFESKAFVHIYRTYYTGMVKGFTDGVYRDGDTLYVKYREVHPPVNAAVTCDIGVYNVALEIDKELVEGVTKLVIEKNSYNEEPWFFE